MVITLDEAVRYGKEVEHWYDLGTYIHSTKGREKKAVSKILHDRMSESIEVPGELIQGSNMETVAGREDVYHKKGLTHLLIGNVKNTALLEVALAYFSPAHREIRLKEEHFPTYSITVLANGRKTALAHFSGFANTNPEVFWLYNDAKKGLKTNPLDAAAYRTDAQARKGPGRLAVALYGYVGKGASE